MSTEAHISKITVTIKLGNNRNFRLCFRKPTIIIVVSNGFCVKGRWRKKHWWTLSVRFTFLITLCNRCVIVSFRVLLPSYIHCFVCFSVVYFSFLFSMPVMLLVKQRSRLNELKHSAEMEIEDIKKNSPGEFCNFWMWYSQSVRNACDTGTVIFSHRKKYVYYQGAFKYTHLLRTISYCLESFLFNCL